mmetsp:Transcript_52274/g.131241  ORF Transcript_52274/g.131241 Transcript_52274/m.131241 type:complete len:288 (-) Transcript_52274:703-1566(-)
MSDGPPPPPPPGAAPRISVAKGGLSSTLPFYSVDEYAPLPALCSLAERPAELHTDARSGPDASPDADAHTVVPLVVRFLHSHPTLQHSTATLLNLYWPQSMSRRLTWFERTKAPFPVHILLTAEVAAKDATDGVLVPDVTEFRVLSEPDFEETSVIAAECPAAEEASENTTLVVGHCYVLTADSEPDAVLLESVLIHPRLWGQGLGRVLMRKAHEYARSKGKSKSFLYTRDKKTFYAHLGYAHCKPVQSLRGNASRMSSAQVEGLMKVLGGRASDDQYIWMCKALCE